MKRWLNELPGDILRLCVLFGLILAIARIPWMGNAFIVALCALLFTSELLRRRRQARSLSKYASK